MITQLVLPMAVYVFYISFLGILSVRARIRAIQGGEMPAHYFKTYQGAPPPEHVIVLGRHYDNQFQVPLLFLIGGAAHLAIGGFNAVTVAIAWIFVGSRFLHSYIHLGRNKVIWRVQAFTIGWLAVCALWAQLVFLTIR